MIKRLGALVLALSVVFSSLLLNAPIENQFENQTVYASSVEPCGYYETLKNSGLVEFGTSVGQVQTGIIKGLNQTGGELSEMVSISVSDTKVTINDLPDTVENSMVLGNYYTLTVNDSTVEFRFVTRAIANKDDLQVLKLTSIETPITGYYVLANDLKHEKGEELQHDVNGDESGHGIDYPTFGFRGTFDGQGHNVEFWANSTGFFGALGLNGVIKNTAFINVQVYERSKSPVLFLCATHLYIDLATNANDRALVENVYVRMAENNVPIGAISSSGSIPLKLENIVLEFPGANVDHNTGVLTVGALWGYDFGWWTTKNKETEMAEVYDPLGYHNVYILGKMPVMHYKYVPEENVEKKKGFYYSSGKLKRHWMEGFAENEGVTEDIYNGDKVYKGVRKYANLALLSDDKTNDYSSFDTRYWATEEYGLPVWKNGVENSYDIFLNTEGEKTTSVFWLEIGGVETATLCFGIGGISVPGVPLTFEILSGEEFISINSETGVVSAVKEGTAQFKIKCSYNGKDFERKYMVHVSIAEGYIPPYVIVLCSVGGAVVVLSVVAFIVFKKKKPKKQ